MNFEIQIICKLLYYVIWRLWMLRINNPQKHKVWYTLEIQNSIPDMHAWKSNYSTPVYRREHEV